MKFTPALNPCGPLAHRRTGEGGGTLASGHFGKLRDVIMGTTPTLFVSSGVSEVIRVGMSTNANVSVRRAVAWLAESDEQ